MYVFAPDLISDPAFRSMDGQDFWAFFDQASSPLGPIWHDHSHVAQPAPTPPGAADGVDDAPLPPTPAEHSAARRPLLWGSPSASGFAFDFGTPPIQGATSPAEAFRGLGDSFGAQDVALDHGSPEAQAPPRTRPRRANRGPNAQIWNAQKPNIRRLYIEEANTLEHTKKLMKEQYGFDASWVSQASQHSAGLCSSF
jgi:hypothetical protein